MGQSNSSDKRTIISHFVEFFVVGVLMGITEDLIAIRFATEAKITWKVVQVAFWVALPFAAISELLVDQKIIRKLLSGFFKKK